MKKIIFSFTLILLQLCFSPTGFSEDKSCEQNVSEIVLSAEMKAALTEARNSGFKIHVMAGTVAGRIVKIVFFGESHLNSKDQIVLAQKVRGFFSSRATEGASPQNYWFPKFVGKGFSTIVDFQSRLQKMAGLQGSIMDAPNNSSIVTIPLETLEFGHKPSWKEKILALQYAASTIVAIRGIKYTASALVLGCGIFGCAGSFHGIAPTLVGIGGAGIIYGATMFPSGPAFRTETNHFMADNMISGLKKHADIDSLIVEIGFNHIPGMTKILSEKYDFSEVAF